MKSVWVALAVALVLGCAGCPASPSPPAASGTAPVASGAGGGSKEPASQPK